jgi:integrase/recombinase XerD
MATTKRRNSWVGGGAISDHQNGSKWGHIRLANSVVGDDGKVIEPIEKYLAYLTALERSPNTVVAYATSLRLFFEFLRRADLAWAEVTAEDVARFVSWLRAPADNVVVLGTAEGRRSPATVNRHLAAVFGFYDLHARAGVGPAAELVAWRRVGRGPYKPLLHHVTKGRPIPTRPIKLPVARRPPRALKAEEIVAIVAAAQRARDRFLLALLAETGMRIGQALGLRHGDVMSRAKQIRIVARADNANGARAKLASTAVIPVSAGLVRLYSDYLHSEYRELDSDYVFVNLWGGRIGAPLTYATVHKLFERIQARSGVEFTAHILRHTHATQLVRAGVAIDVVAKLLTHRSSTTTSGTYVHLDVSDTREALRRAGVFDDQEPEQ